MTNNDIDYKPLFIDKLIEFTEGFPEYTIGEVIHSVFTQLSRSGVDVDNKGDLLGVTDQELYSGIGKAIKEESE